MATVPRILTYEEWLRMPPVEDGTDEVVKGELRFMPPTRYPHAEIIQRLIARFIRQTDDRVAILGSNFGLMISREPGNDQTGRLRLTRLAPNRTRLDFEERYHLEQAPWRWFEGPIYRFINEQNELSMRRLSSWLSAHPEYRPDLVGINVSDADFHHGHERHPVLGNVLQQRD